MLPASQTKMKSLWILGDIYTVKISGDRTQDRYSVWEIEVAPNSGPPLHKHSMEDEAFYVLEGDFSFPYGSKDTKVGKGQFMYVPRGEFHTYKNIGSSVHSPSSTKVHQKYYYNEYYEHKIADSLLILTTQIVDKTMVAAVK